MTNAMAKKQFNIVDPHELDNRIPKNLMILMEGKPFVLKAGLEWKANQLYGVGKWSLRTEIVEYNRKEKYALVKATVLVGDQVYENFGEASKENVANPRMHRYMLHMAITRAEARALRVATACGMTAVEELDEAIVEEKPTRVINDHMSNSSTQNGEMNKNSTQSEVYNCSSCAIKITEAVYSYSTVNMGEALCMNCQKLAKEEGVTT